MEIALSKSKLIAIAAIAAGVSTPAFAAPTVFFGEDVAANTSSTTFANATAARNNFFANLNGVGTETFESLSGGTPIALTFPGAGTATLTGTGSVTGAPIGGRYAFSGTNYYQAQAGNFTVNFSDAIAAFGFYATDIGDYGGQLQLQLTNSLGVVSLLNVGNTIGSNGSTSGSNLYFGFYDTANTYTSISFLNSSGSDGFGFDDLSVGSVTQVMPAVPEPATWAMMIGGFGMVGGSMRRRRAVRVAYA